MKMQTEIIEIMSINALRPTFNNKIANTSTITLDRVMARVRMRGRKGLSLLESRSDRMWREGMYANPIPVPATKRAPRRKVRDGAKAPAIIEIEVAPSPTIDISLLPCLSDSRSGMSSPIIWPVTIDIDSMGREVADVDEI